VSKDRRKAVRQRKKVERRQPLTAATIFTELSARTQIDKAAIMVMFEELSVMMDEELFGLGGSRQFIIPKMGFKLLNKPRAAQPEREMLKPGTREMITVSAKGPSWKVRARFMKQIKEGISLMDSPTEEDLG